MRLSEIINDWEEVLARDSVAVDAHVEVHEVIVDVELRRLELVGASGVFAARVAGFELVVHVLELLSARMHVVHARGERHVGHNVFVVSHAPSGDFVGGEGRVGLVAHARLAEVVHGGRDAGLDEVHRRELCLRTKQCHTMKNTTKQNPA